MYERLYDLVLTGSVVLALAVSQLPNIYSLHHRVSHSNWLQLRLAKYLSASLVRVILRVNTCTLHNKIFGHLSALNNCIWLHFMFAVATISESYLYLHDLCVFCVCLMYILCVCGPSAWNKTDDDDDDSWFRTSLIGSIPVSASLSLAYYDWHAWNSTHTVNKWQAHRSFQSVYYCLSLTAMISRHRPANRVTFHWCKILLACKIIASIFLNTFRCASYYHLDRRNSPITRDDFRSFAKFKRLTKRSDFSHFAYLHSSIVVLVFLASRRRL